MSQAEIKKIVEQVEEAAAPHKDLHQHITSVRRFFNKIRPKNPQNLRSARRAIISETVLLYKDQEAAQRLAISFLALLSIKYQASLYAEVGIPSAHGFFLDLTERVFERFLPPPADSQYLREIILQIFYEQGDEIWVKGLEDEVWADLASALLEPQTDELEDLKKQSFQTIIQALRVLSFRIAGTALDREFLEADPDLEKHESPFTALNTEIMTWLPDIVQSNVVNEEAVKHTHILIDQCNMSLKKVRRHAGKKGISLRLSYLIAQLDHSLARLDLLCQFIVPQTHFDSSIELFKVLILKERTRIELKDFFSENFSIMASNMIDATGERGGHYIAESRNDWFHMLKAAAGGGLLIMMMAWVKLNISFLALPPLSEAVLISLNYALGFVLIYLLGFTVATKQPAMTAATIVSSLGEDQRSSEENKAKLLNLTKQVVSSQLISILGNVLVAAPLAFLLSFLWIYFFHEPFLSQEKVQRLLNDSSPFLSGALFYAFIAGIGLFLSGVVSGFFDNRVHYTKLQARLAFHPWLVRIFGRAKSERIGAYVDEHFGAIAGNIFFGLYLGVIGSIQPLTGIPLDVRHVAFSSAFLGFSVPALPLKDIGWWLIMPVLGIGFIGMINLLVSFFFAFRLALLSEFGSRKKSPVYNGESIAWLILREFLKHPWSFMKPPKDESTIGQTALKEKK